MSKLLTRKDLAERWQVSEVTIDNWRKEGVLTPCKGIPAPRFSEQYVAELEGVKLERFSPLERKRLEREIEELQAENTKLKGIISRVLAETSQIIGMEGKAS